MPPSRMFVPIPNVLAVSRAMASASPVTILIFTPIWARGRDGGFGIFARRIEQRQHAEKLPFTIAVGPGHTERTKAARGEVVDGLVDGVLHGRGIGRQLQDHLRRPLRHLEGLPSAALTVASVRLCTGSNGWKCVT